MRLDVAIDPAIPALLTGDDARVRQILFNLVGNSFKFTEHGSVSVGCALEERLPDGTFRVTLRVADTGIGIPAEKQGTIFDAFTQVDSSTTKKYPGTGLGLSIVKRLVDLMGGQVTLESEEGNGTAVTCALILGVACESLPESSPEPLHEEALPPPLRALDILVAEDDAVGRFAIRSFLQRAGHRVVCVSDGRQALEALQIYPFDCLFTDIQMPDMDGVELARRVRTNDLDGIMPTETVRGLVRDVFDEVSEAVLPVDPRCVIVAVSAHTMTGDKDKFLQHGIDHYIAKPIAVKQLNEVLQRITA
ncbi:MAG: Autoinducer 2 sensor kinase/phosphatase LuxQ [Desulfovibrio sp.]